MHEERGPYSLLPVKTSLFHAVYFLNLVLKNGERGLFKALKKQRIVQIRQLFLNVTSVPCSLFFKLKQKYGPCSHFLNAYIV